MLKKKKPSLDQGDNNYNSNLKRNSFYSSDDEALEAPNELTDLAFKLNQELPNLGQSKALENHLRFKNANPATVTAPQPSAGPCRVHSCRSKCTCPYIRTLYSKFPRDYFKLGVLHFSSFLVVFLLIYPLINFFWTYYFCENPDVVALFYRITDRAHNNLGLFHHLRGLEWMTWAPLTAETFALMVALAIKDCALLNWEETSEASSLCSLLDDEFNNREDDECFHQ